MADRPWAMASPGSPWAIVGSPPPTFSWGSSSSLAGAQEARTPGGALEAWKESWTGPAETKVSWT